MDLKRLKHLVARARKLLFDSRCLEREVSLYRERLIGDVAFGMGPYPAATLLPPLLIELRSRYPDINTRVEVNNSRYLADHLRAGHPPCLRRRLKAAALLPYRRRFPIWVWFRCRAAATHRWRSLRSTISLPCAYKKAGLRRLVSQQR